MKKRSILFLVFLSFVFIYACCKKKKDQISTEFDRRAMLENMATNQIVTGYSTLFSKVTVLKATSETFTNSPSEINLQDLQTKFLSPN